METLQGASDLCWVKSKILKKEDLKCNQVFSFYIQSFPADCWISLTSATIVSSSTNPLTFEGVIDFE